MILDQKVAHKSQARAQWLQFDSPVSMPADHVHGFEVVAFAHCYTLYFSSDRNRMGSFHHNGVSSKYTAGNVSRATDRSMLSNLHIGMHVASGLVGRSPGSSDRHVFRSPHNDRGDCH